MKTIQITKKKAEQFNSMLFSLRRISKKYQTPDQLRRSSEKHIGLEFEEALEYAYENIQTDARTCCKGVTEIAITEDSQPLTDGKL